jgi:salicylate hydroxylase
VLALIPGFDVDKIPGQYIDKMYFRSWIPEEEMTLAENDVPIKAIARFGYQMKGVDRTGFRRLIVQTAKDHGVDIYWEHSLVSLEQVADEVRVKFENGHTDTASFVIGCDGLHSNTRASIFGREKADFTGLTQVWVIHLRIPKTPLTVRLKTAGESLTAEAYSGKFAMTNIYGNGVSMITYPISDTTTSWA